MEFSSDIPAVVEKFLLRQYQYGVLLTRSYYCKWSAALQYFTRLAWCTIECEVIVQTQVSVLLISKYRQAGWKYEAQSSFFNQFLEIRGWTLSSVWTCFSNSSIFWEKIETKFGCNLPPISKYWLNINFFWIFFVNY